VSHADPDRALRRRSVLPLITAALLGCGGEGPRTVPAPVTGPGGGLAESVSFTLPGVDGEPVRLIDHRGEVVLVNFFATWCSPCLLEIPQLAGLVEGENKIEGFTVIGVAMDVGGAQLVSPFRDYMKIPYPLALADDAMLHGRTPFGTVRALPASFLIDPDGRHVETFRGIVPLTYLRRRVRALASGAR